MSPIGIVVCLLAQPGAADENRIDGASPPNSSRAEAPHKAWLYGSLSRRTKTLLSHERIQRGRSIFRGERRWNGTVDRHRRKT